MKPFWNRAANATRIPAAVQSRHRTNVFLWFTLILLFIVAFDLWFFEASEWMVAGNCLVMVAGVWLVLAKMR